jgi:hypothetical protein
VDVYFLTDALHVEAHLLNLLTDVGATPVVDFFLDAGNRQVKMARDLERLRGIGMAEMNKGRHGGPPGDFIGHDMVSNSGTTAVTGSDTR